MEWGGAELRTCFFFARAKKLALQTQASRHKTVGGQSRPNAHTLVG